MMGYENFKHYNSKELAVDDSLHSREIHIFLSSNTIAMNAFNIIYIQPTE